MEGKLVYDGVPDFIRSKGLTPVLKMCTTRGELLARTRNKISEEFGEYLNARSEEDAVRELADILTAVYAVASLHGVSREELEEIRLRKARERGETVDCGYLWCGNEEGTE